MIKQLLSRLTTALGICALCLGATSGSCSLFGRGGSEITVDLATEAPSGMDLTQVVVSIAGLEFRNSSGASESLTFQDAESVDLMDFEESDDVPLRLFTDEELPEGTYTGVRLLFDDDTDNSFVVDSTGNDLPMLLGQGNYTDITFTVDEDENDDQSLTLTLDLRQSLSFDADSDEYTLTPFLRSVPTDEASEIEGTVNVNCPTGSSLLAGGAVYLFNGEVEPDDRDNSGVEPFATASVTTDQSGGSFSYSLRFLPAGDYTLALTCLADDETPAGDEDLEFQNVYDLQLDSEETFQLDIAG